MNATATPEKAPVQPAASATSPTSKKPAATRKPAATAKAPAAPASKARKPGPSAKAAASAKAAKAPPTSKAGKAPKAVKAPKTAPAPKARATPAAPSPRKVKMVRDSFTMPKEEYAAIAALKGRGDKLGRPLRKSEILRAGIQALKGLNDKALLAAIAALPPVKAGRPKSKHVG